MTCSRRLWTSFSFAICDKKKISKTYIIAIGSVEIIRLLECDVGVGDDSSVMEVIETSDMGKQTVKKEDVAFLRHDWGEFLAVLDIIADTTSR